MGRFKMLRIMVVFDASHRGCVDDETKTKTAERSARALLVTSRSKKSMRRSFVASCLVVALACAFARGARAMSDDDDTVKDMVTDFFEAEYSRYAFTMVNETTGEPIEGAGAIVAPTFSRDKTLVGVFIPATSGLANVGATVNVSVCEFAYPEECLNAEPYPGAPDSYVCGISDETRSETGFDCDTLEVPMEADGDLSVEVEIDEDDESLADDYVDAPSPSPSRKLLARARIGRANPARSRTLRTAGTRGFGRG